MFWGALSSKGKIHFSTINDKIDIKYVGNFYKKKHYQIKLNNNNKFVV